MICTQARPGDHDCQVPGSTRTVPFVRVDLKAPVGVFAEAGARGDAAYSAQMAVYDAALERARLLRGVAAVAGAGLILLGLIRARKGAK